MVKITAPTRERLRAFRTLDAAMEAQGDMLSQYDGNHVVVITVMQQNFLNDQLDLYLLPNSNVEYDVNKTKRLIAQSHDFSEEPKGNLDTYDFVTIHQDADRSVLFYVVMDFGRIKNPELMVKHQSFIYPPERAGSVYIVTPIKAHARAPFAPRGRK